jgi:hypothetical protein
LHRPITPLSPAKKLLDRAAEVIERGGAILSRFLAARPSGRSRHEGSKLAGRDRFAGGYLCLLSRAVDARPKRRVALSCVGFAHSRTLLACRKRSLQFPSPLKAFGTGRL